MKKIALVHDYFNEAGGAERVLRVLSLMYPSAKIYTAFIKQGSAKGMFGDRQIIESKWGKLLKIGRLYSYLRFLLPWIWKSLDLAQYDLVITSVHQRSNLIFPQKNGNSGLSLLKICLKSFDT